MAPSPSVAYLCASVSIGGCSLRRGLTPGAPGCATRKGFGVFRGSEERRVACELEIFGIFEVSRGIFGARGGIYENSRGIFGAESWRATRKGAFAAGLDNFDSESLRCGRMPHLRRS